MRRLVLILVCLSFFNTSFGLTVAEVTNVINRVNSVYKDEFSKHGYRLRILHDVIQPQFGAFSNRDPINKVFHVLLYRGLTKYSMMTPDSLTLILCHEIGHFMGGAPWKSTHRSSVEGQADYFANLKCLRKIFKKYPSLSTPKIPTHLAKQCEINFSNELDQKTCMRIIKASMDQSEINEIVFPQLGTYSADGMDTSKVTATLDSYPSNQCRFQTYVAAATCPISETIDLDLGDQESTQGICTTAERYETQSRPQCWHKS